MTKAIKGKKPEDWRNQQRLKTKLEQEIEKSKREYFGKKLEHRTNIWKVINENKNKDESTEPTEILVNGKIVHSPKKLANAFNDGYHEKTEKIRETFTETNIDPIDILNEVISTKNESTFELLQATPEELLEIILKSKNSRTCGFDSINMQILKQSAGFASLALAHLFNSILRKSKFPEVFKISRILPISKPGKPPFELSSYHLIRNLNSCEKVIKEIIKRQIVLRIII